MSIPSQGVTAIQNPGRQSLVTSYKDSERPQSPTSLWFHPVAASPREGQVTPGRAPAPAGDQLSAVGGDSRERTSSHIPSLPRNRAGGFLRPPNPEPEERPSFLTPPGRKWSPASWRTHPGQIECSAVERERSHSLLLLLLAAASRQLFRHLHTLFTAPGDHAGGTGSDVIAETP